MKSKVFLCYHSDLVHNPVHKLFVHRVSYFLARQTSLDVFCYDQEWSQRVWTTYVSPHLNSSDVFVFFVGTELGGGQTLEARTYLRAMVQPDGQQKRMLRVLLSQRSRDVIAQLVFPAGLQTRIADVPFALAEPTRDFATELKRAEECARQLFRRIDSPQQDLWIDGLPLGYPFDYEKDIIDAFIGGVDVFAPRNLARGCPLEWPAFKPPVPFFGTPISEAEAGSYRQHRGTLGDGPITDDTIIVDPRSRNHQTGLDTEHRRCFARRQLVFLEAGPRAGLCFPREGRSDLRVGILVSGGIAPGINAVIDGIVERHRTYAEKTSTGANHCPDLPRSPTYDLRLMLFRNGFQGLGRGSALRPDELLLPQGRHSVTGPLIEHIHDQSSAGGSVVSTSRFDAILEESPNRGQLIDELLGTLADEHQVDICYVIGGEGSMRAAHALATRARVRRKQISIVGVPKTMDNDILWVWQSFGFLSAVEKAREFISLLHTEVRANPRVCVVQLFGSDSGFVVSHAVLASGKACCAALIPEINFTMHELATYVRGKVAEDFPKHPYGIVVLAETAIPVDAEDLLDEPFIGLDRHEKDAVRKFVGSALLRDEDLFDSWPDLLAGLTADEPLNPAADRRRQLFRDAMSPEGVALAEVLARMTGGDEAAVLSGRSRLVDELNRVLRGEFYVAVRESEQAFSGSPLIIYGKALYDILTMLDECAGTSGIDGEAGLVRLMTDLDNLPLLMSLPYECLAIIRELKDRTVGPQILADPGLRKYFLGQLRQRLVERFNRVLFETCFPTVRRSPTDQTERRVFGQTPDPLRSAGLKIVSRCLEREIRKMADQSSNSTEPASGLPKESLAYWTDYRVFSSEPRHLVRAIEPSCQDVIFGHRLGKLAVDNAMAGYADFMISQWLTEYVLVPLPLVVLGRKRVPDAGIFWKSVVASTGQPANLWYRSRGERCSRDDASDRPVMEDRRAARGTPSAIGP